MRDRRRQQHHRQRQYVSLPEHQTCGPEDTSAYVVPRSQSDLLQPERGGKSAPFPVALDRHRHQSALEQIGHVDIVRRYIPPQTPVRVLVIPDAEPEVKVVMQGVEALNLYKADQIIALGGGSVIDAAKIMKLKYESPEADLEELAAPFLDIRKRVVQYPTENANQVRLIAISTTSGTGSEVTPFAVLTDKERGRKVTLADYSLSPDVAIVDPQFVMSMPKRASPPTPASTA
jgi:alcohol dehydrogenase class IV